MAVIPGREGLGNTVTQPRRYDHSTPPVGLDFATELRAQGETQVAESRRAALLEAKEAEAARKAADQASALTELQYASDDLASLNRDFAEGVQTGKVDKTTAVDEWASQARERIGTALQQAPAEHRGTMQRDLEHRLRQGELAVRKAVTQRDQADVRSGIEQTLEYAQRLYATEPAKATALAQGALEGLGPHGGLTPDVIAQRRQKWNETAQYTAGLELITQAKNDRDALKKAAATLSDAKNLPDLDPKARVQFLDHITNYQDRLDRMDREKQAHALALRAHALKVAEAASTTGHNLADRGILGPDVADELLRSMAGTPFQDGFKKLLQMQRETGPIARQPVAVVRRELDALDAMVANAATPENVARRDKVKTIADAMERDYREDPIGAAKARGRLGTEPLPDIDMSTPAALVAGLMQRAQVIPAVDEAAGRKVSLLRPTEAEALSRKLSIPPPAERADMLNSFTQAVGAARVMEFATQIKDKDQTMAIGAVLAARSAPTETGIFGGQKPGSGVNLGALYFKGIDAVKNDAVKFKTGEYDNTKGEIAKALAGVYRTEDRARAAAEAAAGIWAGLKVDGVNDVRKAVTLATGGIMKHNDQPIALPSGMKPDQFTDALKAITPDALAKQSGGPDVLVQVQGGFMRVPVADLASRLGRATLRTEGDGTYTMSIGGGKVYRSDGSDEFVLKVR